MNIPNVKNNGIILTHFSDVSTNDFQNAIKKIYTPFTFKDTFQNNYKSGSWQNIALQTFHIALFTLTLGGLGSGIFSKMFEVKRQNAARLLLKNSKELIECYQQAEAKGYSFESRAAVRTALEKRTNAINIIQGKDKMPLQTKVYLAASLAHLFDAKALPKDATQAQQAQVAITSSTFICQSNLNDTMAKKHQVSTKKYFDVIDHYIDLAAISLKQIQNDKTYSDIEKDTKSLFQENQKTDFKDIEGLKEDVATFLEEGNQDLNRLDQSLKNLLKQKNDLNKHLERLNENLNTLEINEKCPLTPTKVNDREMILNEKNHIEIRLQKIDPLLPDLRAARTKVIQNLHSASNFLSKIKSSLNEKI